MKPDYTKGALNADNSRRSRSRSCGQERRRRPEAPAAPSEEDHHPTAAQVCNMLCEMFSQKGSLPPGTLDQCFSKDPVPRVSRLSTGAVAARGQANIAQAILAAPACRAQPAATVFVEAADKGAPSMALAFFAAGTAPGLSCQGLAKPGGGEEPDLAVLLRCQQGKIDQLWVAEDTTGIGAGAGDRAALLGSELWRDVMDVLRENIPSVAAGTARFHMNNYAVSADTAGLGIGETSAAETFTLPPAL
eukprot:jgi/Tetstr1/432129/TSEL_021586.t1